MHSFELIVSSKDNFFFLSLFLNSTDQSAVPGGSGAKRSFEMSHIISSDEETAPSKDNEDKKKKIGK